MAELRVLLIGATGVFGSRLAELAAKEKGIALTLAARDKAKLDALATRLGGLSVRQLDRLAITGADLKDFDLVVDAACMPFEDASFATALSVSMLEHALDPVAVLREMVRVTRPGGLVLVTCAGATANGASFVRHNPPDRWRPLPGTVGEILTHLGCDDVVETPDPQIQGAMVVGVKR